MGRKSVARRLKVVHSNCAGIDVDKSKHYVAVDPESCEDSVRSFGPFTDELAAWLKTCGVEVVAIPTIGVETA